MGPIVVKNDSQSNSQRKKRQMRIALKNEIEQSHITTGLDDYQFVHQASPEIDLTNVDLSIPLFAKKLRAPLVISSMIGDIASAKWLNPNLDRAAQSMGLAMCIGSQRCAIDDPSVASTYLLVPVATGLDDSESRRQQFCERTVNHLERLIGEDIRDSVVVKRIFSHRDYEEAYHAYQGTSSGLAHTLLQTAVLRRAYRSRKVKNLYYTGHYTHPGIGVTHGIHFFKDSQ